MQNTTLNILKTVAKTYEKVLRLNITVTKVKVANFHSRLNSYITKQLLTNFGRHKDLSTLKSGIHLGLTASVNMTFSGR